MEQTQEQILEQIRLALLKSPQSRSFDDLLLLKSYLMRTELVTKNLMGIINPRQMNDICRTMQLESFKPNEYVFQQGDIGDKVYVLLSGSCEVRVKYKIDLTLGESETREKLIVTYSDGHFFGERALLFDEPRSASILCISFCDVISISKVSYLTILQESERDKQNSSAQSNEVLGSKESVIKILSKAREKRNNRELEAVASYLSRRIQFFQKFSTEQLIELCRVAETLSLWGRSILFKQGQIGQAFYVILTGNVEVWVDNSNAEGASMDTAAAVTSTGSTNKLANKGNQKKTNDLTDGLGKMVNLLVTGDQFGERALENESSRRMGSIITCDGLTELLIISKEDYHNLVYMMVHAGSMERLSLLRKTEIFRTTNVVHLRGLARFMEPRKYQIGEVLLQAGNKTTDLIIIQHGECEAEVEIMIGTERSDESIIQQHFHEKQHHNRSKTDTLHTFSVSNMSSNGEFSKKDLKQNTKNNNYLSMDGIQTDDTNNYPHSYNTESEMKSDFFDEFNLKNLKKKVVKLGRIAPYSILSKNLTLCGSVHNDIFHTETIRATSLVTAYTVGKHDFYNHMTKDTRQAIVDIINQYPTPELIPLWENTPKILDEDTWKRETAWNEFKQKIVSSTIEERHPTAFKSRGSVINGDKKSLSILDLHRKLSKAHLTSASGNNMNSEFSRRNRTISAATLRISSGVIQLNDNKTDNMIFSNNNPLTTDSNGIGNAFHVAVTSDWGLAEQARVKLHKEYLMLMEESKEYKNRNNNDQTHHVQNNNKYNNSNRNRNNHNYDNISSISLIRNRINENHILSIKAKEMDLKRKLSNNIESNNIKPIIMAKTKQLYNPSEPSPMIIVDSSNINIHPNVPPEDMKSLENNLISNYQSSAITSELKLPFSLVQIHREYAKNGADNDVNDASRRP
eukprot:gene5674-7832_t